MRDPSQSERAGLARNLGSTYIVGENDRQSNTTYDKEYSITPWLNVHQVGKIAECWRVSREDVKLIVERVMALRKDHDIPVPLIAAMLNPPRKRGTS